MNRESSFQLGPWLVRPTHGTLTGPEGTVHLEPKVMEVLVYLVERAGDVVTRDQFIERVWHGRVVTDEVLSRCISLLRTHLGDNPREPRYIQTVPKIGYRMVWPIEPPAEAARAGSAPTVPSSHAESPLTTPTAPRASRARGILIWTGIGGFLLAVAWGVHRYTAQTPRGAPSSRTAIAVLPFANISGDPANEYFSDGLTEEIIDRLTMVPGLRVAARTSAFSFKDKNQDVRTIAARLGVDYILEGSVRKEGNRVRITAQLVDATRGFHVWSEPFDVELGSIFVVQDEIANAIVSRLSPRLAGDQAGKGISTQPPTRVIEAYELLLRGRYHLKRRDEAPIRRSIALFEQALKLDPGFVEAYCDLARAYALLPYYSYEDRDEMFDQAIVTIDRGAAIKSAVREASQDTVAFIHFGRWEWVDAEEGFRRALSAQPTDPNLQQWYSQLLASVGYAAKSLEHAQIARSLDVLSPVVNDRLAVAYLWINDDERARQQFELAGELGMGLTPNPEAYVVALLRRGEYQRARDILVDLQKLFAHSRDWIDPFIAAVKNPTLRPAAVAAVARAADAHAISLRYQFGAWLYLGEADRAMNVAQQLLEERGEFDIEFLFAREASVLRSHPRFGELVTELGLEHYWDRYGWPPMCARMSDEIKCH